MKKFLIRILPLLFISFFVIKLGCDNDITEGSSGVYLGLGYTGCDKFGTLPIRTVEPVTESLTCDDGIQLSFQQGSVMRYACLNYPDQADSQDYKWPLVIYLHGSLVTPTSLYHDGKDFFDLRNDTKLSFSDEVRGFIILSPEGRIAKPYNGNDPATGEGFHWDEWYRNPEKNLDAQAIDHFLDTVISLGKVDTNRIYVYGWSNGAFMTVLYSTWRSSRIAAMGQYAGANPWDRPPCPISISYSRQVPLFLLRNLCDKLVPCSETDEWIDTLTSRNWPFKYHNLDAIGYITSRDSCSTLIACNGDIGLAEHFRWPRAEPFKRMLEYFRLHPLHY